MASPFAELQFIDMIGIKDEWLEDRIEKSSEHITAYNDNQSDKDVMPEITSNYNAYSERDDTDS